MSADFRVGPWLVKPSLNTISRNGTTARLEPKVMEVLVCLAGHADEALSKEELVQAVWPETFVSDDNLKRCISELRRVFEDDAREPRIIQTIPKRGYRLLAPVQAVSGSQGLSTPAVRAPVSDSVKETGVRGWWVGAAVGTAILLSVLLVTVKWIRSAIASGVPPIHSLAVLPLQNLSADPAQEYFSDGMTDALITDLAQISSVKVISRTSSMQYKQTKKSLPEIARELGVDAMVEGTVQRSGDRVRITAQLIQGSSDKHIWAHSYDGELRDTLQLQGDVANDIAHGISTSLGGFSGRHPALPHALNIAAYDDYLKGRNYVRRETHDDVAKGVEFLEHSIQLDPNQAAPYAELSFAYQALTWFNDSPPREALPRAKAAALKALSLDENLAEAHAVLGQIYGQYDWDWGAEERELRRAIELDPNCTLAHWMYATYLVTRGHRTDALREINTLLELDPFSPLVHAVASMNLLWAREYEAAIREARRAIEIDVSFAGGHLALASVLGAKGEGEEGFTEWLRYLSLDGHAELAQELARAAKKLSGPGDPGHKLAHITISYYQRKSKKQYIGALIMAEAYMDLGDKEKILEWLDKAFQDRSTGLYAVVVSPAFDPLRDDPRFQDLLRRMNIPGDSARVAERNN